MPSNSFDDSGGFLRFSKFVWELVIQFCRKCQSKKFFKKATSFLIMSLENLEKSFWVNETSEVTYKRFRRRIIQRSIRGSPAASTPVTSRWRCEPDYEFDPVCQRLELESSPRKHHIQQENSEETDASLEEGCTQRYRRHSELFLNQRVDWLWTAATQADGNFQHTESVEPKEHLQPFADLQGLSGMTLAAPSLLNDYYTNLLDCSCDGLIALALDSSVFVWNSETRSLVGHLDPSPDPGRPRCRTLSISCLRWSRDGRTLCFGNRRGEIQFWDVDRNQNTWFIQSHLSVVAAISWKQQLLSSGSLLGHIHHLDPRAAAPVVGAAVQKEGVCSLQWSPGNECLASGSTDGVLHIWDGDITGFKRLRQPINILEQPSAVKALGWCPWQRKVIATGGGWKDGKIRIWDTQSGSCLTSVNTNSQICSLQWAEKKRCLVTSHGLPHHQITCWNWEFPSLRQIYQFKGHCHRVLHLAINPDNTHIFSAGADQRFHIWDLL